MYNTRNRDTRRMSLPPNKSVILKDKARKPSKVVAVKVETDEQQQQQQQGPAPAPAAATGARANESRWWRAC